MVAVIPNHIDRVKEARRRRLEELEVQAARRGIDTPPEIANEIEDLQQALAGQDEPPISEADRYAALMRAVMLLSQQVAAIETVVEKKYNRLTWLLPAMMFCFLILEWIVRHI